MSRFFVAILAAAAALPLAAGEAKFDADSLAKSAAPFLDDRTLIVAHIDSARLDAKTMARTLARLFGSAERDFEPVQKRLEMLLPAFRKAGGSDLYVVFSLIDLNEGPFFVAPVKDEGKALTAFFKGLLGQADQTAEKIGTAVVAGPKTAVERLRKLKPAARPELAKAFAAAGDGAAQVCLLPPAVLRRAIEEMLPELPEDLGGVSIKELTQTCQWAAAGVEIAPAVQMRLTVQATGADSAKTLHSALNLLLKALAKNQQFRPLFPNGEKAVPLAMPKLSGDRLTLMRDEKELTTLLQPVLAPFAPQPRRKRD